MRSARHQSRKVRHVDQKQRANFIRNLPHAREIDDARIRASPANNQLRLFFLGKLLQLIVIDRLGFLGHAIRNDLVSLARKIQMMAVREMSAMRQIQAKNRVARLQNGRIGFHVRLRSRMGLNIGVLGSEQLLRPVARQVLDHIGKLAATVITLAGISLGILVRKYRSSSFEHGFAHKIL